MHSDVYGPNWSKLGLTIGIIRVYTVMLVLVKVTFIQGHMEAEN